MTVLASDLSWMEVDGTRLEWARWGSAQNGLLPICLMHEGLGSVALWKGFPQKLADATGRMVVAWSRQGHGQSQPITQQRGVDYMHREAKLMPDIHRQLGLERAHWFGQSDGGSIALIGAALFPELVASMVLEAPHVFVEEMTVSSISELRRVYEATDMQDRMRRYHADPEHIFRNWNDIWLKPSFIDWNIEELLPMIKAPTLLIQGLDDEFGTLEQLYRIETMLPQVQRLELENCGHAPHQDQDIAVLEAVQSFLKTKD